MDNPVLDHLVYAVPDLEAAVDDLERRTGVRAATGGSHPGRGTRNALIGLGSNAYLEILAPDPSQPSPDGPRWLGVDEVASRGPRLSAWAVRTSDLAGAVRRAEAVGVRLGDVVSGSRRRADGVLLSWRLTDARALGGVEDGLVPFFIDWGASPHPSASAPGGIVLAALRGEHPRPGDAATLLGNLGLELPVTKGEGSALIAVLQTPRGLVELK